MRDWYRADNTPAAAPTRDITWIDIFTHWEAAELDLSTEHGVDIESGVLDHRTWRWLSVRILDCAVRGPRLSAALKSQHSTPTGGDPSAA